MQAGPLRLEPFALGVEPDGVVRRNLKSLLTERLGVVLEERSVRLAAVGTLLVASSALALVSTPMGIDYGWMFVVPIAISAIAVGVGEGLVVAFAAALLFLSQHFWVCLPKRTARSRRSCAGWPRSTP